MELRSHLKEIPLPGGVVPVFFFFQTSSLPLLATKDLDWQIFLMLQQSLFIGQYARRKSTMGQIVGVGSTGCYFQLHCSIEFLLPCSPPVIVVFVKRRLFFLFICLREIEKSLIAGLLPKDPR